MRAGSSGGDLPDLLTELRRLVATRSTGSRLPAERELAVRLGVGRALVRRALRELAHSGTIRTRAQSGSYVC
ncbi:GntR family transcriptional regulator [Pseudonocardia sp. NPDC049154]|uniref:GntR family transcriptional regulator n=1 Tax=Pseudonocardia sp. NPDC049154 TaxID=3155501 RepID=UPI0034048E50